MRAVDQDDAEPNAVVRLRRKLARDAATRARERYFCIAIVPALLFWAMLVAGVSAVAGALIPLGVALTVYAVVPRCWSSGWSVAPRDRCHFRRRCGGVLYLELVENSNALRCRGRCCFSGPDDQQSR